jgi:uncharacterized protein YifE (UPF0438 family)
LRSEADVCAITEESFHTFVGNQAPVQTDQEKIYEKFMSRKKKRQYLKVVMDI